MQADQDLECVVVQQPFQETQVHMPKNQLQYRQDAGFVVMLERVVEIIHFATEDVQKLVEYVGKAIADQMVVCVPKAAGQEQVGVQLVQHVDAVLRQIIGVIHHTTVTAVLFVTDVQTVGVTRLTAEMLTEMA